MKRNITIIAITIMIIMSSTFYLNKVYAKETEEKIISNETESTLVELKEREMSSLEDYEATYGSKAYGLTAYILHIVQVYSIPFCFLGIMVGAIYDYVLGIRHIEAKERGLAIMVTFITVAVICQVLPLVFTIVVKFGRE